MHLGEGRWNCFLMGSSDFLYQVSPDLNWNSIPSLLSQLTVDLLKHHLHHTGLQQFYQVLNLKTYNTKIYYNTHRHESASAVIFWVLSIKSTSWRDRRGTTFWSSVGSNSDPEFFSRFKACKRLRCSLRVHPLQKDLTVVRFSLPGGFSTLHFRLKRDGSVRRRDGGFIVAG